MSTIIDIPINARWTLDGITVAGENKSGSELNQLHYPSGLHIDHDGAIYIADSYNHRIVKWVCDATSGQIVAGGNGEGDRPDQLNKPTDVIVDKEDIIICDYKNRRVVKWPRRNGTSGETIISNIDCWGLAMDDHGSLYVSDFKEHVVKRWRIGESDGMIVAGNREGGSSLNQLNFPTYIFVDQNHSVYVSEQNNPRVTMWMDGAKEGIVVAGGQDYYYYLKALGYPQGVVVDQLGTVYVVSEGRIIRWTRGATQISVIVNGRCREGESKELSSPSGLSFDRQGNIYVADYGNHRVQKFSLE